jgi:hypothetical protein
LVEKIRESEVKLKMISTKLEFLHNKIEVLQSPEALRVKAILGYFDEVVEKELLQKLINTEKNTHVATPEAVKSLYYTSAAA